MTRRRVLTACLLVIAYSALTIVLTYPLAWKLTSHHVGEAGGDAKIYLWNYWWVRESLTTLHQSPFATSEIFFPVGIGLALHTLGFWQGLLFIPLATLAGDVLAANLVVMLTFVFSAVAMYALARHLGASATGGFLAGLAFAFCPYRMSRLAGHYDLLGTEWIPLYVLLLLKLMEAEKARLGILVATGLVAAACGYTASSYLVFLAAFTLIYLLFHFRSMRGRLARPLGVGVVALAALGPLVWQAQTDLSQWTYERYPGADRYAADLFSYFRPAPQSTFFSGWSNRLDRNVTETTVFTGYVLLIAGAVAAAGARHRKQWSFWLVGALAFALFSFGARLSINGHDTGVPMPFALIAQLPLLEQLRAPSRLSILVVLCLASLLALVWTDRTAKLAPKLNLGLTGAVSLLMVLEYLVSPVPLFAAEVHPLYKMIASDPDDATVIEIPGIEQDPGEIMFHQRIHGKRILIGTAARVPREKSEYFFGLHLVRPLIDVRKGRLAVDELLLAEEKATAPHVARFLDLGYVVVDKAYAKRGVVEFLTATLPTEVVFEDETHVLFRVLRNELPPDPTRLPAASPVSRQHYETGWLRPEQEDERGFRWANHERSTLLFRRPSPDASHLVLTVAPLGEVPQHMVARLDGRRMASVDLKPGWQDVSFRLPPAELAAIERLELTWSSIRRASERDPRRLAARVSEVRFEAGAADRD